MLGRCSHLGSTQQTGKSVEAAKLVSRAVSPENAETLGFSAVSVAVFCSPDKLVMGLDRGRHKYFWEFSLDGQPFALIIDFRCSTSIEYPVFSIEQG